MVKNEIPIYEIISGAALAFAALLLIIPGFLTDLIGFLLIIPVTRKIFIKKISSKIKTIITPRGGGTSLSGQTVNSGIVVDFSKYMNKTKEKLTEVNTTYARIVLVLLAFNLLLTGYAVTKMVPEETQTTKEETVHTPVPETEQ